jgi:hypothetical protein
MMEGFKRLIIAHDFITPTLLCGAEAELNALLVLVIKGRCDFVSKFMRSCSETLTCETITRHVMCRHVHDI